MSNLKLQVAVEDIVDLLTVGIQNLKDRPLDKWSPAEAKMLEIYNKITTACLSRDRGDKNPLMDTSSDDLEKEFE